MRAPKFDSVKVGELGINAMTGEVSIKAAFVNAKTGETHGWTTATGTVLSDRSKEALQALLDAIERDLDVRHFADGDHDDRALADGRPRGLADHLGHGSDPVPPA